MASQTGTASPDLDPLAELKESPSKFGLYAALRLLENAFPGYPRVGHANRPAEEPYKFGQLPNLGFASASPSHF